MRNKLHEVFQHPSAIEVIIYLYNNRNPINNYQQRIAKDARMTVASVQNAINILLSNRLIYLSGRTKLKKCYSLTSRGNNVGFALNNLIEALR